MLVNEARNVAEAWARFRLWFSNPAWVEGNTVRESPRGCLTSEIAQPVATVYAVPSECVLLDPVRDCNPFFHLYESLWILAGRSDVRSVAYYSPTIAQFSDDGTSFTGAYGQRLRSYFGEDQVAALCRLLREESASRRGVLQMWDAKDLNRRGKDVPCNTTIYVKVRSDALNLTVCNRSNDAVWGCYGANAVHFAVLQEYLAAQLGVCVGTYTQVSDSLHVYEEGAPGEVWNRVRNAGRPDLLQSYSYEDRGLTRVPLVRDVTTFEREFRSLIDDPSGAVDPRAEFEEPWLALVAHPLLLAYQKFRQDDSGAASYLYAAERLCPRNDWLAAGIEWLERRYTIRRQK